MGFGIPIFEWFSSDLKKLFEVYFQEDKLKEHNLLNQKYIDREYKAMSKKNIVNLWLILVFQMWYQKYKK